MGLDDRMRLVLSAAYQKVALIQGDLHHPSLGDFAGARENYHKAEMILAPLYATKKDDPDMIARWRHWSVGSSRAGAQRLSATYPRTVGSWKLAPARV